MNIFYSCYSPMCSIIQVQQCLANRHLLSIVAHGMTYSSNTKSQVPILIELEI